MFCIKCGKKAVVDVFCEKCFLKQNELFEISDFSLTTCKCSSYYDMRWRESKNIEELITMAIEKRVKINGRLKNKHIKLKTINNRILATIRYTGLIKPCRKEKTEEKTITITIKNRKCDKCVKLAGGYYEAVLQIRGSNQEIIFNKIRDLPNIIIEKKKEGYDIKFLQKRDAENAIKELRLVPKRSFKFVATKKGRKLYRKYYAVR